MAIPKNIDVFNKVVAETFIRLYDNFPRPIDLDPLEIGMSVLLKEEIQEESEEFKILIGTPEGAIDFLVAENFIRFKPENRHLGKLFYPDSVLTAKGLALLNLVPDSVNEARDRRSYIERIKALTADGLKAAIPEAIGSVIGGLLGAG